jgi:hypothetical protein
MGFTERFAMGGKLAFPLSGRKRSLFFKKSPQKTFVTFTRDVSTSPGLKEQKFFASFFQKRSSYFI